MSSTTETDLDRAEDAGRLVIQTNGHGFGFM